VRRIELAAAFTLRAVWTLAVVDALWYLAAFAIPTWDAAADLGGNVALAVARATLAADTWARTFVADRAKPAVARFVALAFLFTVVVVYAFTFGVADLVTAGARVARGAVALPTVHGTLLTTVRARDLAAWTHPTRIAALANRKAGRCGTLTAVVAVAATWAVEQLAASTPPTVVAGALLLV